MSNASPRPTVEKLLDLSGVELAAAQRISKAHEPQDRFCWRLEAENSLDDPFDKTFYDPVKRAFGRVIEPPSELVTVSYGSFEVWDHASPNLEWLKKRASELDAIGSEVGAFLDGWSYEPIGYPAKDIPQVYHSAQRDQ
ncbi:hypothetical protein [Aurantiacibacter hainanensis]|uniref:hypothetical protein n=1 Tax=Aurantiacibacter hainanensis TaxID=3076114 RepID=UPI0030C66C86